ncbi:M20 family metallo-hydrolase [Cetobacterium somerae]|uniref:M20 family metallo-hydrolase n=1 Tax=Cetobacterium sp. NK01 TaxID=2993530 RepID=UPI00211718A8|nr:M20 family metallo-hydrolase [Cetobacterium sp. NK01]MCQ8213546.1 M20 family metallo-hydrolase [Cetobacterium sp. NK01]
MKINIERIISDLEILNAFNSTPENGCTRFSFTIEDTRAKEYLMGEMKAIGMEVWFDGVGNLHGLLKGNGENKKIVMSGSHIDTVTNGGKYDGNLGVIGALEVARVLSKSEVKRYHDYQVSIFIEEEGPHFGTNLIGSKAFCKNFSTAQSRKIKDSEGNSMYEVMKMARYNPDNIDTISFEPSKYKAMLELHIEQGRVLDLENKSIGIVKGIVGLKWFKIIIKGESNHAGATPMKYRLDPVVEGCKLISEIPNIVKSMDDNSMVATVGKIAVFPNQTNIISKFIEFTIDLRGIDEENLLTVVDIIESQLDELKERGFYCEIEQIAEAKGVKSNSNILDIIEESIKIREYSYTKLYSGANHDTSILGEYIPSAMIFVPSINGRSHCKEEFTKKIDIKVGCQVLCDTIYKLVKE